jgi:ribosomal protein L27
MGSTSHSIFLLKDGTVRTVGRNDFGQCGTGNTNTSQLSLYTIPNLNNVKQIACGGYHTVFLLKDGTVRTVGFNNYGQCGTGNTSNTQLSLYTIPNLNNVKQVACGGYHIVFLLNDGTVRTVGRNDYGQCGTGNTNTPQLSLYTIPNLNNVKQIACGYYHTVFLLEDGTVRTVGYNEYGQCGTGNTNTRQLSLYTIPNLNNVKRVACGEHHTVFLLEDGTVRTVGSNEYGQCGAGKTNRQLSLYTIPNLNNVKQIACGLFYTVFLLNDYTVRTVGYNEYGQCGNGNTNTSQLSLYTIPDLNNVRSLWDDDVMIIKYLIKQYNNYYSINPEYYNTIGKTYIPLTLEGGLVPTIQDIYTFGFRGIRSLTVQQDIDGETFKPIDKLFDEFEIKMYKLK